MGKQEGIRPYVPPKSNEQYDPVEFGKMQWRLDALDDAEHGSVTKVQADVKVLTESRSRTLGAFWTLIVINGVMGFIATVAAIYSAIYSVMNK